MCVFLVMHAVEIETKISSKMTKWNV